MRIRCIKPEFFTHEGLFELERETNLPMRVAYAGLWSAADRNGRFKWEPRRLGISILPYDGIDFSRVLHALLTRGFIVRYRVGDAWFGAIPSWEKHQIINNRESPSVIPDVSVADELDASGTRGARVGHAGQGEGKGREGKGKDLILPAPPAVASDVAPKVRGPNVVLEALAGIGGADPRQVPKGAWAGIGKALADIRTVSPEVDVAEIQRRGANYNLHFKVGLGPHALAKHWAICDHGPMNGINQSEFTNAWGPK